jgi:hypothetical protein
MCPLKLLPVLYGTQWRKPCQDLPSLQYRPGVMLPASSPMIGRAAKPSRNIGDAIARGHRQSRIDELLPGNHCHGLIIRNVNDCTFAALPITIVTSYPLDWESAEQ